jgi:2-dehydro-3-deoxygalactonokinase
VTSEADWVAVDWGTSKLRAWGIDACGKVVFSRTADQGMRKLAPDAYPHVLGALLGGDFCASGPQIDVLVCGMAGARQGWLEAPYLDTPADLGALGAAAVAPANAVGRLSARILPGVCQRLAGAEDVMRGEETQLLGLSTLWPRFSGIVCLPGTHSKWAQLRGRRIERFATVMTGELYDVLCTGSVLRHSLGGHRCGPHRTEGCSAGLAAGIAAPEKLLAALFQVRAGALLSGRTPDWCAGFLSGLLIGSEIGAQRHWTEEPDLVIIGESALANIYAEGWAIAGGKARVVDGSDATLAGLKTARRQT